MPINQPSNQIKLTNVSIVRLKKGGKRFEAACYKNKVLEWRSGVETDIDEVLQIHSVFLNVSKGQVANNEDLRKCFKTDVVDDILKEILKKGELQVGEKERGHVLEQLKTEISLQISSLCVNPSTNRPYPPSMIQKALDEIGFSVRTEKSAKSQALEGIKKLAESKVIPIQRARMRLRVSGAGGGKEGKRVREKLSEAGVLGQVLEEDFGEEYELIVLVDPGKYRGLQDVVATETKGRGTVEVLDLKEIKEGEEIF